jgi:RNA polymerase sigma-70 factor (ECF subfamily)
MLEHGQDVALMQQAAAGNRDAQETVLRRLRQRVHVVASSVLRHPQDAEDATQTALILILNNAGSFRGESRLESWAARVAAREALRLAQQRHLRAARTVPEDEVQGMSSAAPPPDALPAEVRSHLDALPEAQRSALVLRHVLGYTVPEIAALLSTSPNTIKDRLHRAREAVRRRIRRENLANPRRKVNQL